MNLGLLDKTIVLITKVASDLKDKWAYVGSTASYIEGQSVISSDIDIMTTQAGVEYFAKKLQKFTTVETHFDDSAKGSSWYVKFLINGIEVEVMGELVVKGDTDQISTPKEAKIWEYLNYVDFKGLSTPLFPDEFQIATNSMTASREQRVANKARFMLKKGYRKELIKDLINENELSQESIARIKKYLPL